MASAPAELRKGPRGGGREWDAIADHVREAERSHGRTVGVRPSPGTAWPERRAAVSAALRNGVPDGSWPARYAVRRFAWHVLDHAWEIEDKSVYGSARSLAKEYSTVLLRSWSSRLQGSRE
ncbi:MAG: hypothetical protein ACR2JO_13245 [Mycobacteriales bacterium]